MIYPWKKNFFGFITHGSVNAYESFANINLTQRYMLKKPNQLLIFISKLEWNNVYATNTAHT